MRYRAGAPLYHHRWCTAGTGWARSPGPRTCRLCTFHIRCPCHGHSASARRCPVDMMCTPGTAVLWRTWSNRSHTRRWHRWCPCTASPCVTARCSLCMACIFRCGWSFPRTSHLQGTKAMLDRWTSNTSVKAPAHYHVNYDMIFNYFPNVNIRKNGVRQLIIFVIKFGIILNINIKK